MYDEVKHGLDDVRGDDESEESEDEDYDEEGEAELSEDEEFQPSK